MNLDFARVTPGFANSEKLDALMQRQFPPEEYMSLEEQLELQSKGDVEIWALYDHRELVGFTTLRVTDSMAYLFFLAFDDKCQGKGYGSEVIQTLGKLYQEKAVVVDFELVNPSAVNNEQRIRRRNFYLKNGFRKTGWGLAYMGVQYEIFCMNRPFRIDSFKAMLNNLPIRDFSPQYFNVETA